MKIGFVTCVELGRGCIQVVFDLGGRFDYLGTLHDDLAVMKSGRTWIDDLAEHSDTLLRKFRNINDPDAVAGLREADLDWLCIIGWSQIAGPEVLSSVRLGVLGMHPTLLPEGRGRASIPWAILKDLDRTGVSLFQLDEGVDTGPVLARNEIPIEPAETATNLYGKVSAAHRDLMREIWPRLKSGNVMGVPQDETKATEWSGRGPWDGELMPSQTVAEAERLVRATTHPYPGAFIGRPEGRFRIWQAHIREAACDHSGEMIRFSDGFLCVDDAALEPIQ